MIGMMEMNKLSSDISRCTDANQCEKGKACLRSNGTSDNIYTVWSSFRTENLCNKENNYKMIKLPQEKGNGDVCENKGKNSKKT
jgi:hypothetical protein